MADDYDMPRGELMRGKKGLVIGVANRNSIAFGIASQLAAESAPKGAIRIICEVRASRSARRNSRCLLS